MREREEILQSFMDFVDRVLALQGDSTINKFSFKCKTGVHRKSVDRWICNVLQRGVTALDICIDLVNEYFMPNKLFVSGTLVELKVTSHSGFYWWAWGEGSFLPMLKTMVIDSAWMYCIKMEMFLLSFPELEELSMALTKWTDWDETLSSASLRKLSIYSSGCKDLPNPKSVSFDRPTLLYLYYFDFVAEDYPKVNLINLVEARIKLSLTKDQIKRVRTPNDDDDGVFPSFGNVWKLMSGIRNVQKLYLSFESLEVLSLCCASIPVFNNRKMLHINSEKENGWQAMPVLLRNSPHLETLALEGLLHFVTDKCGDVYDCVSREEKGHSLMSCPMKMLQIKGFRGTIRELETMEHFLESFRCLKEMEIYAEERNCDLFKDPEKFKLIVKMFKLYDKLYTCDVQFLVRWSLHKEWTAQW